MMRKPVWGALGAAGAIAGSLLVAGIATAASSDVRVGNFYFEDASVGDGQIVITEGDQLRFIVDDNGAGTQHTVDIDAFGVHSGHLAKGETFTTAPLTMPGTYALYCDLHRKRGHETTLVILPAGGTTTTSAPTATSASTATSAPPRTTNSNEPSIRRTSLNWRSSAHPCSTSVRIRSPMASGTTPSSESSRSDCGVDTPRK